MKSHHILTIAVLSLLALACSKDDEMRPLTASNGGATFDTLNTCPIGGGADGTLFIFRINLQAEPTVPLGGVEFDLKWSNGDESEDIFEDDLVVMGNTVEYDWCFRYGSTDWFELTQTIVDDEGKPLSNDVKIRVDKPAGAN